MRRLLSALIPRRTPHVAPASSGGGSIPVRPVGLSGDFPDWQSALAASQPYETDLVAYGQVTDRVRLGESGSGRNSMPILAGLALTSPGEVVNVLDFGGNLGMVYYDIARALPKRAFDWRVVDCEDVARHGNAVYADDRLSFSESVESACRDFLPDLVLCSHTLQYLEEPYETLGMLCALQPTVIVLHELPVGEAERFMIQRLPESLGGTERPVQILANGRLTAALAGYEPIAEMDLPAWDPHIDARHVAQVYRRRSS